MNNLHASEITKSTTVTGDICFNLYYILRNNQATSGFTHHRAQFSALERAEQYLMEATI